MPEKKIEELSLYDMDTLQVPVDRYEWMNVPDTTRRNMQALVNKINELVEAVNELRGFNA